MKKATLIAVSLLFVVPATVNLAISQENGKCKSMFDCAQKAMEAAFQAKTAIRIAVPKGAVMAFNLKECPDGWGKYNELNGRVIVGAGHGRGLTVRTFRHDGGSEQHTLTVQQMPAHNHGGMFTGSKAPNWGLNDHSKWTSKANTRIPAEGGGQPHNIMQPYHVLQYCERK